MTKLSSQTTDPSTSSDSDSEFINRVVGAPIAPLSKKSIENFTTVLNQGPPAGQTSRNKPGFKALGQASSSKMQGLDLDSHLTNQKKVETMRQIISYIARGRDCSQLFPAIVKLVVAKHIELRKLVFIYLERYASENPDIALLTVSTFQRGLLDTSPAIRASSLKILSSMVAGVVIIMPVVAQAVLDISLKDQSAYVRRIAAIALIKLFDASTKAGNFEQIKPQIYQSIAALLNDKNSKVTATAVQAYCQISQGCNSSTSGPNFEESELQLLHTHFNRILFICSNKSDNNQISPLYQAMLLEIILKYSILYLRQETHPTELKQVVLMTRFILMSCQESVTLVSCLRLFYYLNENENEGEKRDKNQENSNIPDLKSLVRPFLRFMSSDCFEIVKLALSIIFQLANKEPGFRKELVENTGKGGIALFFHKTNLDSREILKIKLKILSKLVTENNANMILLELKWYLNSALVESLHEYILTCLYQVAKESYTGQEQVYTLLNELADNCLVEKPVLANVERFGHSARILLTKRSLIGANIDDLEENEDFDDEFDRNEAKIVAEELEVQILARKELLHKTGKILILYLTSFKNHENSEIMINDNSENSGQIPESVTQLIWWFSTVCIEVELKISAEITRLIILISKKHDQPKKLYSVAAFFSLKLFSLDKTNKLNTCLLLKVLEIGDDSSDLFVRDVASLFRKVSKSGDVSRESFYSDRVFDEIHGNIGEDMGFGRSVESGFEFGSTSNYCKKEIYGYQCLPDISDVALKRVMPKVDESAEKRMAGGASPAISVPVSRSSTLRSCTIVSSGTVQEDEAEEMEEDEEDFEEDEDDDFEEDVEEGVEEECLDYFDQVVNEKLDEKLDENLDEMKDDEIDDKDVVGKKLDMDKYVDANLISPESEHSFKMEACADDDSIT